MSGAIFLFGHLNGLTAAAREGLLEAFEHMFEQMGYQDRMASTPILPGDSADASSGRCTLRSYGEPIDVRQGLIAGCEAPEQFLWRDRLWVVRRVLAHWVETGAWWEQAGVSALLGISSSAALSPGATAELLEEREVWRVEAARSRHSSGVFDLAFSWGGEPWRLLCSID